MYRCCRFTRSAMVPEFNLNKVDSRFATVVLHALTIIAEHEKNSGEISNIAEGDKLPEISRHGLLFCWVDLRSQRLYLYDREVAVHGARNMDEKVGLLRRRGDRP